MKDAEYQSSWSYLSFLADEEENIYTANDGEAIYFQDEYRQDKPTIGDELS